MMPLHLAEVQISFSMLIDMLSILSLKKRETHLLLNLNTEALITLTCLRSKMQQKGRRSANQEECNLTPAEKEEIVYLHR